MCFRTVRNSILLLLNGAVVETTVSLLVLLTTFLYVPRGIHAYNFCNLYFDFSAPRSSVLLLVSWIHWIIFSQIHDDQTYGYIKWRLCLMRSLQGVHEINARLTGQVRLSVRQHVLFRKMLS